MVDGYADFEWIVQIVWDWEGYYEFGTLQTIFNIMRSSAMYQLILLVRLQWHVQ